ERLALKKYEEALPLWRRIGDRRGEALTLVSMGMAYYSLGERQKAVDFLTQALSLHRAAGDREDEATTLYFIGDSYQSLGENQKAIDFYAQALPLARAIGSSRGEALTLGRIASTYFSLGEWRKAIDFYNQSLPLQRAFGDQSGEATTLGNIGYAYKSLGENQKAVDFLTQSLPLHRAVGNRNGEAITLSNIGAAYSELAEYQKALDFHTQALALCRAIGDRYGEATTLGNIGLVYKSLGENQKALDFLTQAAPLYRAAGDRSGVATTLGNIGALYDLLGEYQKALDFHTQALPLHRAVGDRKGEAIRLSHIGALYDLIGERQKALDFLTQALALHHAVSDRKGEAITLGKIGVLYNWLGERQKALDFLTQALELCRAIGDRSVEATTLSDIGLVYKLLGEKRKALDFYTQALALQRAVGDRRGEAATLSNIGAVYTSLNELRAALDFHTQVLALHRAVGNRNGEAITLSIIGAIYTSLGENQRALDFHTQALAFHRAAGNRSGEANTIHYLGVLNRLVGENQKALDFLTQALTLSRMVGDRDGEVETLILIADIKRDLGHFDESLSYVESALKIVESLRANVISKELRASYLATAQNHYTFYIDLLMQLRKREPNKGHEAAALETSERARARSLIESLAEASADIRRGADPKLIDQERSLQQRLNAKARETLKLSSNGADEARLAMSRRETDALTTELQQVQTQIRQTSPRYSALTQPQPLTLAEIQRQALDADTLLLEYSLGKERSFLWAVTPTSINSYELPKREEIEATAKRVYELLSKAQGARGQGSRPGDSGLKEYSGEYLAAAKSLSRTLLGPVAGQLGKKRLVIVADGMLHYIPFGALPDPNSLDKSDVSWQPLLVEHEIVNLPSASTIAVLRRELAGRKPAAKTLAVLADPVFSRDDERIRPGASLAAQRNAQRDPLDESRARILVEIGGGAPNDLRIKRLPFTRQEAEAIMSLAPAGAGIKALDFEASRATATGGRLSQYRYVHFATHGLADADRPELSTLLLSLYDVQGRPQDGFLRAHEVYNLELPAELVTLSACETGLGKLTKGEGLVSLTRGFMYAGAARVVVSLWSVSDRATAELMTKFYRSVLVRGERPAAALRAAQVEMWRDKRWEAPYYWAAFTLQGEWR
ncbi:MAG TPA: CHAT domain-containing tetratricopeptide repeat protein, partial [Blastocatellia bacterium]|nr:CHAT domain-containing tetratricopeptide repeat protein [Blastocatellia bacterium]